MLKIKSSNTILYCKQWQQTVDFYQKKLELEVATALHWFVEFRLTDHSCLSIADESRTSMTSNRGEGVTITLEVEDIEMTYAFLKAAGCNPDPIKDHPWGAKVIYVYDPEGNRVEFWR